MKFKRKNKEIGNYTEETNTFTKKVKASKHLFKSLGGGAWGIDGKIFTEVLLPNNAMIILHECEQDMWYSIDAEDLKEMGTWLEFGDHGKQIFLETRLWN